MTRGPESVDLLLARRIHARRVALNLSQKQLAEAMGLSFQQIQKYEQGKNKLTFGKLLRMANCLRMTVATLTEGLEEPVDGANDGIVPAFMGDAAAVKLAETFALIRSKVLRNEILRGVVIFQNIDSKAELHDDENFHARPRSRRS